MLSLSVVAVKYKTLPSGIIKGSLGINSTLIATDVSKFFSGKMNAEEISKFIQTHRISYIFWGPTERIPDGIDLSTSPMFELRYEVGDIQLYEVQ